MTMLDQNVSFLAYLLCMNVMMTWMLIAGSVPC